MLAELDPEAALDRESADADSTLQELPAQSLEGNHFGAFAGEVVIHNIDEAHPAFVNVEDLKSTSDPLSDRVRSCHEQCPSRSSVRIRSIMLGSIGIRVSRWQVLPSIRPKPGKGWFSLL
jgi:hypothetical protein